MKITPIVISNWDLIEPISFIGSIFFGAIFFVIGLNVEHVKGLKGPVINKIYNMEFSKELSKRQPEIEDLKDLSL